MYKLGFPEKNKKRKKVTGEHHWERCGQNKEKENGGKDKSTFPVQLKTVK